MRTLYSMIATFIMILCCQFVIFSVYCQVPKHSDFCFQFFKSWFFFYSTQYFLTYGANNFYFQFSDGLCQSINYFLILFSQILFSKG